MNHHLDNILRIKNLKKSYEGLLHKHIDNDFLKGKILGIHECLIILGETDEPTFETTKK